MHVEVCQAGRIYTWDWAIRHISAEFRDGECVCVLGANGSGKTTFLKLISSIIRPTEGKVLFDGIKLRLGGIGQRRELMLLHPDPPLIGRSLSEHIGTAIAAYGQDRPGIENVAAEWIRKFGIEDLVLSKNTQGSRGQKMKTWFATLFTLRPKLWLLDEPHQCGLDAHGMEIVEQEIASHRNTGGIVIFTSQWPPHARRLADRMLILEDGGLVYDGALRGAEQPSDLSPQTAAILRSLESESIRSL